MTDNLSVADNSNRQEVDSVEEPDGKLFVLVTAHCTVLDETEHGELEHVLVHDAQLNLFFDKNGIPLSKNSWRVLRILKGLRKWDNVFIIVHRTLWRKKRHLCADVRGGFSRRKSVSEWDKYRLLPLELARAAKTKRLPLDVVVATARRKAGPSITSAPGEKNASEIVFRPPTSSIPRIIHQTYSTKSVPSALRDNVKRLRRLNPSWLYQYWNDDDIIDFINDAFGWSILRVYLSINPQYGAARADLFRYLCVYHYGGVYLDIKSGARVPFDEIFKDEDEYILSYWKNEPGDRYYGFGLHPELRFSPRGELQQWHVIAAPGYPLLGRVIETVLVNIKGYHPDVNGCGKQAVLRLTGPIAYTAAIYPYLTEHKCRVISAEESGFEYNVLQNHHGALGGLRHYSQLTNPIVI